MITMENIGAIETEEVILVKATMSSGFSVSILNLGATLVALETPDRQGYFENILVGYADISRYLENPFYMGSTVGRMAGRVSGACWNGHQLTKNCGPHHIHGGKLGFSKKIWRVETKESMDQSVCKIHMTLSSDDGEEGYPGQLEATVTYWVHDHGRLEIVYEAVSNKDTLVNFTNHAYFNLSGALAESVEDHELFIDSNQILELGTGSVPTGQVLSVDESPFDFRLPTAIGSRIKEPHLQLQLTDGYDHPWLLNRAPNGPQVTLQCLTTGRLLEIETDQPCAVIYSSNFDSDEKMISGKRAFKHDAVCIECQNPPVAMDGKFIEPSVLLAGQRYRRKITFQFKVKL